MTRILLIEDEQQLARALHISLGAHQYDVDVVATTAEALELVAEDLPDLVLLDLSLSNFNSIGMVLELRGWSDVPIVVLCSRNGQRDKVDALAAGADDYVTKPFGMDDLLARVSAALQRSGGSPSPTLVETSSFRVDLAARTATGPGGGDARLTPKEWHVLEVLLRSPRQLVTQRQLLAEAWGPGAEMHAHYLRIYLGQLRRKLEANPARPRHLVTDPGVGYRFEP